MGNTDLLDVTEKKQPVSVKESNKTLYFQKCKLYTMINAHLQEKHILFLSPNFWGRKKERKKMEELQFTYQPLKCSRFGQR